MTVSIEHLQTLLQKLEDDKIKNLEAQADARRVLQEIGESTDNYPSYDKQLSEKNTYIAYILISIACDTVENNFENQIKVSDIFERASKILSDNYQYANDHENVTNLNLLISSMSFYCAKQFSKAYITIGKVKTNYPVSSMINYFLKKDFDHLFSISVDLFYDAPPQSNEQEVIDRWIVSHEVARCFMIYLDTLYSGHLDRFNQIESILIILEELCQINRFVDLWLVIRLLKIIFRTFENTSIWQIIPPLMPQDSLVGRYIRLLSELKPPITELWPSQLSAVDLATGDNSGGVVNLRTSGGKTRVAEIAILKTLIGSKGCKVLYLAPFRSLAFEIEQSLSKIFEPLGFGVSQLYGGSTLNKADIELFRENQIIIATPEKSKAMIRADSEIFSQIEFIVVDEGHLIGKDHRNIKNEMFLTHIREIAKVNDKRILLLSAVLPNAHEIAEWVAGDETAVSKSSWKPSSERFGLLKWDGKRVRLDWLSGERPFNPNFVESAPLGFGRRRNPFPNTKNEAVAATAVRLSESGPVMIFSARANSINGLAKNVLLAMGQFVEDYDWDENLWSILEHTCEEELEQEDIIVNAARKGIICHSNRLTPNVRIALERLMRSKSPKIIIASSTLAQGVNIGISTIIVSTPFFSDEPISSRDFWNICGRAGRAFSDSEGKILYAIDMTQEQWRVRRNLNLARNYYKENQMQNVQSGLNYALYRIYEISLVEDISFELLIEKLANDTFISDLSNQDTRSEVCELFDLFDDELLSMNHDFQEREDDVSWIDSIFCDSLAFIQAAEDEIVVYTEILKGRTLGLLRRTREIKDREIIVSTGLPFSVAEKMIKDIGYFREAASVAIQNGIIEESDVEISATLLKKVENWAYNFAPNLFERSYAVDHLDDIRVGWLQGVPINELREINQDINDIVKDYYGYTIPWILHAISQIFHSDDKVLSELYSKIAILAELGLPNSDAINVYLCGVKSRRAAIEIGSLDIFKMKSIFQVKKLLSEYSFIESDLSMESKEWIEIFHKSHLKKEIISIDFPNFTTPKWEITEDIIVRVVRDKVYLSTIDGYHFINVQNTEKLPFYEIANIPGLYFTNRSGVWYLKSYSKNYSV